MTNGEVLKKIKEQKIDIKNIQKLFKIKRDIFVKLKQSLEIDNITILTGLRRTGKTILMKQLILDLINQNQINKDNILFFSFDEVITRNTEFLDQLIRVFLEGRSRQDQKYIFLDEIQYINFWQGIIKKYYELNLPLKFIISGSSSVFIKEKMADSLAGRVFECQIQVLSFSEYGKIIQNKNLQIDFDVKNFLLEPNLREFKLLMEKCAQIRLNKIKDPLRYLLYGEFPETVKYQRLSDKYNYINNAVYKKLIEYDLPEIFTVQNKQEFTILYDILIKETGNLIEINNLSREIGISKDTLKNYLDFFNQSFLWDKIFNFTRSIRKKSRSLQKHYIASPNFYSAKYGLLENTEMLSSILGKLVETKCFWTLKSLFSYLFFYQKQNQEIDFYVSDDPMLRELIPVEVKWKEKIKLKDFKHLQNIMERRKIKNAFVLARDFDYFKLGSGSCIWVLPAWVLW